MEQNTHQDFSAIPSPPQKDHTPYIEQVITSCNLLKSLKHVDRPVIHPVADFIIYTAFLLMDDKEWLFAFKESQRKSFNFFRDQDTHWKTIALGLSTPEVERVVMERLPNLDREKYFPCLDIGPAPEKITAEPLLKKRSQPPCPRKETIFQLITKLAPSINYLQVFILMSRHTNNRFSARGRKVYPYGQEYVARRLDISLRSVRRIFSWLRLHHIIFKRSNENYKRKKCATWFVCTSRKQSVYFLDPKGQRSKKRSLRSPRKRHRRVVHT